MFCIKNLGLDPDTSWNLIQQQPGSGNSTKYMDPDPNPNQYTVYQ
jgi:hypothetical protein